MERFYFTYGCEGQDFRGGWTRVISDDRETAIKAFTIYHPMRNGLIPCSSIYSEQEFEKTRMGQSGSNLGAGLQETIVLTNIIQEGAKRND